ncbi:virulence-associated E family protein [Klebsiella pneumoniae]|uniref:VapE domain-containing protein n=1 Tax=Klebsiella pneumoniae TaxID=573 RepID=UPI00240CFF5E|nr:VapE domain-containing protein [Klebsiella pneumoniae]WFC51311.1 virulence-associated E family protein [Klebsiella pneumoniae]WFC57081.1 virulence-associated E family protein [Klebsiella pneumoniae]
MRNAPNVKLLPKDPFTEAIIFAGSDAWSHAKGWEEGMGKQVAGDTTPPVYLGPRQLADLDNLRIIDDGRRSARVYLAGDIEQLQISTIADKLAVAGVKEARLFKGIPDREPEKWNMDRLRDAALRGESLVGMLRKEERATAAATAKDIHDMTPVLMTTWPNIGSNGQPLNTRPNVERLLDNYSISAKYNEISKDVEVLVPGVSSGSDARDNCAVSEILSLAALNRLPISNIEGHIKTIAVRNTYNPVRDFINQREWDGRSRFADLLNTISTPDDYSRDLLAMLVRRWLLSAVAAAYLEAGFWSKGVLVFQGEQSLGKTAWFKALLPPDNRNLVKVGATIDPSNKDSVASAISHWLVELGELDATFRKADIAKLKAFISQDRDDLRRPYDRLESKYQRRTVFFASVNPKHFLADDTGNVRWWTIPVTAVNYEHGIDTQQLWAEVLSWFEAGERWWLDRDEEAMLEVVNEQHGQTDPIEEMILARFDWNSDRLAAYIEMTATDVLLSIGQDRPTKSQATQCGNILRKLTGRDARRTSKGRFYLMPPKVFGQQDHSYFDGPNRQF